MPRFANISATRGCSSLSRARSGVPSPSNDECSREAGWKNGSALSLACMASRGGQRSDSVGLPEKLVPAQRSVRLRHRRLLPRKLLALHHEVLLGLHLAQLLRV